MARSKKSKGGRPGTSSWTAILNYCVLDKETGEYGKWQALRKVDEDGNKTMYFDDKDEAIKHLEDLQIESEILYTIFIQYNDTEFIMKPQNIARINYDHLEVEEESEESTEENEQPEELEKKEETIDDLSELDEDE